MRTRTLTIALMAGLLGVIACQPQGQGPATTAVDTAAVLSSMDSLRSAYQQAVAEDDFERLDELVAEDARIVQAGGAAWDSVRADSEGPFPPGATLEINPIETRVLSADWVYELGTSTLTYTPEGADEARTVENSYLVLLHRTADGWKVYREVASS